MQDLGAASRVFWTSYSVWQRSENDKVCNSLLHSLWGKAQRNLTELNQIDTHYERLWDAEYEAIVESYTQKCVKYADAWMESPAGQKFSEVTSHKQYHTLSSNVDIGRTRLAFLSYLPLKPYFNGPIGKLPKRSLRNLPESDGLTERFLIFSVA